jgi:hypothetical protein
MSTNQRGCAVEVSRLGRGGEDVGEEKIAYTALREKKSEYFKPEWCQRGRVLTVATMPTSTTTRLKLCCVVRTAFSPGESSDHFTRPVSPVNVIDLRCGGGGGGGDEVDVL